jgi:hypothetical protein
MENQGPVISFWNVSLIPGFIKILLHLWREFPFYNENFILEFFMMFKSF